MVADVGRHDQEILADCARRLAGLTALLVGVRCPIATIMERRNASPEGAYATGSIESPPAPVRRWQEAVHRPGIYDLEVDTSSSSPFECAAAIAARLASGPPIAFRRLEARSP